MADYIHISNYTITKKQGALCVFDTPYTPWYSELPTFLNGGNRMTIGQWWLSRKWLFCRWLCNWTVPLVVRYGLDSQTVRYQIVCKGQETLTFFSREFGELIAQQGVGFAYNEKTAQRLTRRIRRLGLPDKITEQDRKIYARYTLIRSEVMDRPDFRAVFDEV